MSGEVSVLIKLESLSVDVVVVGGRAVVVGRHSRSFYDCNRDPGSTTICCL